MQENSNDLRYGMPETLKLHLADNSVVEVRQFMGSEQTGGIPYRVLGRTGEKVSLVSVGGYHLSNADSEETSIRIVRTALDNGINFLDNSWDYHEGESERRAGKALRDGYREKAFVMSKIDGQTKESCLRQIDESLRRLQTDHVDLMQFHEVIRPGDPERIFGPGGSVEGMLEAKKAGKVRHIGFTGHKDPNLHVHMLDMAKQNGFEFDTVQMPLNVFDAHYNSFGKIALPRAIQDGVAVLGMKPLSAGVFTKFEGVTAPECLRFAMSLPVSVVITGCESMRDLEQALKVAREFQPMTELEAIDLLRRTKPVSIDGHLEEYKTTGEHDSTNQHPEWLG